MNITRPGLLSRYRSYLIAATVLFVVGILLGITLSIYYPELIQQAVTQIEEQLRRLGQDVFQSKFSQGVWILFLHNLRALGLIAVLGLLLGIYPVFAMLFNGLIIGVVGVMSMQTTTIAGFLAGIVPHGILEIPAILLGASLGLRLGIAPLFSRKKSPFATPKPNAWQGYRRELAAGLRLLVLCTALLFLAAIIEVGITPHIMALFTPGT
ncbi:MAG TPA: hypothetical protein DDZ53_10525 [Firmicutes bacterium]|jgi:stage II sporulation protein M|nr:hypothetical protein [Bacillota bacterium]